MPRLFDVDIGEIVEIVARAARKKRAQFPEVEPALAEPEGPVLFPHFKKLEGPAAIFERFEYRVFQG